MFTALLAFAALLVAGCAAYFSVLGIATLFSGHFWSVIVMAGSLELGKLVATSFLYRYWNKVVWFLKIYMIIAVLVLMGITSLGIYGYLSSGYQVNAGKTELIDNKAALIVQQKDNITKEVEQINSRINTLNDARKSQETRLPQMSRLAAKPVYEDMARSAEEIKGLTARVQELQTTAFEKDNELILLNSEGNEVHDIGTFKFVAESVVLAYNIARGGSVLKETKQLLVDQPIPARTKTIITEEITEEVVPSSEKTRKYSSKA